MESFFRRMSSIVRRNSNKSSDVDEHDEEDNEQQQQRFRQMRERRLSAPDIRRRAMPVDRISSEFDQKATLFEQTNSPKLMTRTNTNIVTRKNYRSAVNCSKTRKFLS
ncbi:unnamed protein product [Rotaria sp. Silwood1]|nr:unnamed protein product [Rotaria sp. Silwood1]CAF1238382.1 unnamed protein product [Rotaria sp. Silwood1]CAF1241618.1 unnamed protein product [Rotaria sp. Silwood1]CAF3459958.1 unnamed protein product [Rotaria sp. Silwood1]CAF3497818.1 unnamed protein product [Rotaria sp. Silwood1]